MVFVLGGLGLGFWIDGEVLVGGMGAVGVVGLGA